MEGEEDYLKLFTIDADVKFGQGGCCVVFQGWRLSDNKEVEMKKINKSEVDTWGKVNGKLYPIEYFHLRMLAKAGCSRIANILDAFEVEEEYILVLETLDECYTLNAYYTWCCELTDLSKEQHCKLVFHQIVEAVQQCHQIGIFHRDIKMANILIDVNTNEVKLLDFDISALACHSPFEENPGTDGYIAPEMYDLSTKYEGSPAAVYSMGVVLYDMIFQAAGWNIPNYRKNTIPKVSVNCLDLICKMTATRPEDRLPFDKILLHPWMQSTNPTGH